MFNIGIIGASRIQKLVNLTDRLVPLWIYVEENSDTYYDRTLRFYADGRLGLIDAGQLVYVSQEWHAGGPTAGLGSQFDIKWQLQAGTAPQLRPAPANTWVNIGASDFKSITWYSVAPNNGGRILVSIRDKTSQIVLASARFWTPGYAP